MTTEPWFLHSLSLVIHFISDTQEARQLLRPKLAGFRFNSKVGVELELDKQKFL